MNGDFDSVLRVVCADYFKNIEPTLDIKKENKYFLCAFGLNEINGQDIEKILNKSSFWGSYKNDFFGEWPNFKKITDFKIVFDKNVFKITDIKNFEIDEEN